jgi:hypothetical protein
MHQFISMKTIAAAGIVLAAGILGAACSSDPEPGTSSGGGEGGEGGTSATQSSASGTSASSGGQGGESGSGGAGGAGGAGGSACGDTQTDPMNCGSCGNACTPGLTCEAGSCVCPTGATASLPNDVQPIFTTSCVKANSCHGATMAHKLDLRDGMAYAELVGVESLCADKRKLVTPSKPEESYLLNKLTAKGMCDGDRMPKGAAALTADKIATITKWICGGALEN